MNISIISRTPISTPEGGFETQAFEFIPGETVEQLVSRIFYRRTTIGHKGHTNISLQKTWTADHGVLELRLIKEQA